MSANRYIRFDTYSEKGSLNIKLFVNMVIIGEERQRIFNEIPYITYVRNRVILSFLIYFARQYPLYIYVLLLRQGRV